MKCSQDINGRELNIFIFFNLNLNEMFTKLLFYSSFSSRGIKSDLETVF